MMVRTCWFVALVVMIGCDDSSGFRRPPPKQLAEFEYKLGGLNPMLPPTVSTAGVVLVLDGKKLGPYRESFELPRTAMLGAATLHLLVPTNCGEERVPVKAEFQLPEARQRADLEDWISNGGNHRTIGFGLRHDGDWPASAATVQVDNSRGKTDAVVKIGDEELKVAPGKGMTARIDIGTCAQARSVAIAGDVVGELPLGYQTTLIDVRGGSCYVYETTTYAAETAEGVPASSPPRELIRNRPGQHLVQVQAASFMSNNPESVTVRGTSEQVRNAVETRRSLNPIACSAIR